MYLFVCTSVRFGLLVCRCRLAFVFLKLNLSLCTSLSQAAVSGGSGSGQLMLNGGLKPQPPQQAVTNPAVTSQGYAPLTPATTFPIAQTGNKTR